ncbi:hypothetical protein BX070DRAFT_14485 [Coemansia spiralis]|nr:hypothetical protein BX070DRAFT_14485 [Coemansia spiralis]
MNTLPRTCMIGLGIALCIEHRQLISPMARCHELIKVISMRQMLRKHGFTVYLIDEFQSSSTYSECKDELEMFHYVDDLRPWRRRVTGDEQVKCHGLLKCKNEK